MKQYRFPIIIEKDKNGYFALCPGLQGCYTEGATYEDALANIQDAVKLHLEDRLAEGEYLPETQSVSLSTIEVAV